VVVDEDGSPHGPKTFVLWNPPLSAGQKAAGGPQAPLAAAARGPDGRFNLKRLSHTEGRVRARMNKCAPCPPPPAAGGAGATMCTNAQALVKSALGIMRTWRLASGQWPAFAGTHLQHEQAGADDQTVNRRELSMHGTRGR